MNYSIPNRNSSATQLLLWVTLIILAITVGGRIFQSVELTDHFVNEHPECRNLKREALSQGAKWDWTQNVRGPCAFYHDIKAHVWLVIIPVIIGAGKMAKLILITAFKVESKDEYLNRRCNRL